MKYSKGNVKLGKNVLVMSRPVGDTCPADCFFLGNGCYAQTTERRFPAARKVGLENLDKTDSRGILVMLWDAIQSNPIKSIRIHERGDFVRKGSQTVKNPQGQLNKRYLNNWLSALKQFEKELDDQNPLDIWTYTHLYHPDILKLDRYNVKVYASVNSDDDKSRALKAGFTLFAYGTQYTKYHGKVKGDVPKRVEAFGELNVLVCPEQRLGKTTCDVCRWCVTGKGSIAFLKH